MPLLLGHHQLLLLLLVSVAAPHVDSADDTHDSSMCLNQSYTCGSLVIRYPFYLSGETRDLMGYANSYCGYPGMGVFCDDGKPFLQLDGTANYTFMSIDYANATVSLVDPEVVNSSCPRVDHNVTFARGSWLNFPPSTVDYLFFFLGCYFNSSLVQQPSDIGPITCQGLDNSSFVIPNDGVPPGNWSQACSQVVQSPVLKHGPVDPKDAGWRTGGYGMVLSQGFQVSWDNKKPTPCLRCELSKGRCSYSQPGEFIGCLCSNGRLTDKDCSNFTTGHKNKNTNLLKVVLPIIAGLLILACMAFVRIWKYKASKRQKKEMHKRLVLGYLNASNETRGENVEFSFFSFEDIAAATDNFSVSKQIGRGGFGKVYKGKLKGVNEVAIKRLSKDSGQGIDEFKNEIVLIAKLQHRNLVRLLGCCIHEGERLLVYEYLPNKSLDGFLFDATKQYVLDWPTRFEIVKGVARGLLYLHQDSRLTIVHRDLKASNILLDSEMSPKISDFGMARIFCRNQHHANTNRVVGTYGYMSPEYVMGGAFSVKSDTYSFGVLLLEIVSGLKISSPQLIMNFVSLTTYAWRLWEDGKAIELVDSSVIEKCPLHEVLRCIHVGLLCVQDRPDDRPLISSVIFMLENGGALLPAPKQPAYSAIPVCETEQLRENMENYVNEVSITTLEGR